MVVYCNGLAVLYNSPVVVDDTLPWQLVQNYQAAEEAFMQVLKLDSKCEDARQELNVVRTNQLVVSGHFIRKLMKFYCRWHLKCYAAEKRSYILQLQALELRSEECMTFEGRCSFI